MRIVLVFMLAVSGCSTQLGDANERSENPGRSGRPLSLPAAHAGVYTISRNGDPVGEERYTVTSSAGRWVAEGAISLNWPLEQTQTYRIEYDLDHRRPSSFEVTLTLLGETQRVVGHNDGAMVTGEVTGIVDPAPFEVAYGPGTMIDFGSPLYSALLFALLREHTESPTPLSVRSIVIAVPFLRPAVLLQELRFFGRDGQHRKVAVGPSGRKPTAYWVRADGMPVKVKTWADEGGAPFVYELEP